MKTFVRMAALCAVGASLLTSCQKEEQAVNLEKEPQTAIELMEKEAGKTFFKKDLVLKDASGQNEVVMRFASKSKEKLEKYLSLHVFHIVPVLENEKELIVKNSAPIDEPSRQRVEPEVTTPILSEAVTIKLATRVKGYRLQVNLNGSAIAALEIDQSRNGRVQLYENYVEVEHISDVWPTELKLLVDSRYNNVQN